MATICKRAGGEKWLIRYKDENGKWRTVAGYRDKSKSLKKAEMLEFEAERRRRGDFNIVSEGPSLDAHLDAYSARLSNNSAAYAQQTIMRIKAFGFRSTSEMIGGRATESVQRTLDNLKTESGKASTETKNHYLTAIKGFGRYLFRERGLPLSPICGMQKQLSSPEIVRRAATDKEIERLLASLRGEVKGLSAEQRYYLYLTALETGFRAKELSILTPFHFRLTGKLPMIRVKAMNTKNKQAADQPVTTKFARIMAKWIRNFKEAERVWTGYWYRRAAEMFAHDLAAAKIPVETAEGVLDFHALRVTFVTNLALSGIPAKQLQMLARHSTMDLTMKVYAKLGIEEAAQQMRSKSFVRSCPLLPAGVQSRKLKQA
jgi:integrase/recombinase XerD